MTVLTTEIQMFNLIKTEISDIKVKNTDKNNWISIFTYKDISIHYRNADNHIFRYPKDIFVRLYGFERLENIFIKEYNTNQVLYVLNRLKDFDYMNRMINTKEFLVYIDILLLFEVELGRNIKGLIFSQITNLKLIYYDFASNYKKFNYNSNVQNLFLIILKQFLKYNLLTKQDIHEFFGKSDIKKNAKKIFEIKKKFRDEIRFVLTDSILQKIYKIANGDTRKQEFIKYIFSNIKIKRLTIMNTQSLNNLLQINRSARLFLYSTINELKFDSVRISSTFLLILSRMNIFREIETLIFYNTTITSLHFYELNHFKNIKKLVFNNSLKGDYIYEYFQMLNESLPELKVLKIFEFNMKRMFNRNIIYFEKLENLKLKFMTELRDSLVFDKAFIHSFARKLTYFEGRFDFLRLSEIFFSLNDFSLLKTVILYGNQYTYLKKNLNPDISNLRFQKNLKILKISISVIKEYELYSIMNFNNLKTLKFNYCVFDILSEFFLNQNASLSKVKKIRFRYTKFPLNIFTYIIRSESLNCIDLSYSLDILNISICLINFRNKQNIIKINLSGKYLEDLTRDIFKGFSDLKDLNLSNTTRYGGDLIHILNTDICRSLEVFKYDKNTINAEDIRSIEHIKNLKYLSMLRCHFIDNCGFIPACIPIYRTLKHIDCSYSKLPYNFVKSLALFKKLRIFKLLYIEINHRKLKVLQNTSPNCKILINEQNLSNAKAFNYIKEQFSEENILCANY
ncbi:hypothetical protein CWI36_0853p0010 [Hamiltosporidium magnivora]|uniref:Uncharacterized protein n=1 Tax=Hamiltosporidium magnivora TaxID=148818 RepID=A0A4Q9L833_9MICR|nr:hypothetical protein CWI36_0853p0010 [Hamiltosporidium magnivora]